MRASAFVILLLFLTACKTDTPVISTFSGESMTMSYRVLVGHPLTNQESHRIQQLIESNFQEVNALFNRFNKDSELSVLNRGENITLSPKMNALLKLSKEINVATEGRFDPTIFPLYLAWSNALEKGQLPKSIPNQSMQDLGGIAKGQAIDYLVEGLLELGYKNLFVEWGGEMRAAGMHPAGRDWTVALGEGTFFLLRNQAIATSGDQFQRWYCEENGKSYCHIINPLTKQPLELTAGRIDSVSVIAPTCALADGLATALMTCQNALQAKELIERLKRTYPLIDTWITTAEDAAEPAPLKSAQEKRSIQ